MCYVLYGRQYKFIKDNAITLKDIENKYMLNCENVDFFEYTRNFYPVKLCDTLVYLEKDEDMEKIVI